MTERAKNCTASGVPLAEAGSTSFPCPGCIVQSVKGETNPTLTIIGRSPRCRNQGALYNCPKCGHQGP